MLAMVGLPADETTPPQRYAKRKRLRRLVLAGLILVSIYVSHKLDSWEPLRPLRAAFSDALYHFGEPLQASNVTMVTITNKDYYVAGTDRQRPLSPYLADLIEKVIKEYNPKVIGIDIEPTVLDDPASSARLREMIKRVGSGKYHTEVVFAKHLSFSESGFRVPNSPIEDLVPAAERPRISFGYTTRADDVRKIPWRVPAESPEGTRVDVDSFAIAVSRRAREDAVVLSADYGDRFPWAKFLGKSAFVTLTAGDVLGGDTAYHERNRRRVGSVVIIGAGWSSRGPGGDTPVDPEVYTDKGDMPGHYIQANYVESILTEVWVKKGLNEFVLMAVEAISILCLAWLVHMLKKRPEFEGWDPLWATAAATLSLVVGLLLFSWVLKLWNLYYDILIPAGMLWVHSLVDDYWESKVENRELQVRVKELLARNEALEKGRPAAVDGNAVLPAEGQ